MRPGFTKLRMTTVSPSTKRIEARAVCKRRVICWLAMALFKNSIFWRMSIEAVPQIAGSILSMTFFRTTFFNRLFQFFFRTALVLRLHPSDWTLRSLEVPVKNVGKVSFARDIRPLFRSLDIEHMKG